MAAALSQLGLELLGGGGKRGEVPEQGPELVLGAGLVGRLDALVQLILGDPPGGEVLAQLLGGAIPVLIRDTEVRRALHTAEV
jgi:hypothetical protein